MAEFQALDPNYRKLQRLIGGIVAAVVILITALVLVVIALVSGSIGAEFLVAAGIALPIIALVLWAGWFYPGLAYKHASWRLGEEGLEIRQGVWWRHHIVVPRSRVQHSDIEQGPLQRSKGIATLIVHTAGTKDSSVKLEGLNDQVAQRLRDTLVAALSLESTKPSNSPPTSSDPDPVAPDEVESESQPAEFGTEIADTVVEDLAGDS